jgi:transposase
MRDDLSRLLGIEGFAVKAVHEMGDRLDLEVELIARAGCCPRCGRGTLKVKERPRVRVRDLPLAGRRTYLVWRKRRYRCDACRLTFTETHTELPVRQRVTRRFRRRLLERVRQGAAHAEVAREERTTRYQVGRAFAAGAQDELASRRTARPLRRLSLDEAHHRRGRELATVVSDLDRRRVVEVLDGRSRRRVESYLRSLPEQSRRAIEVVSIDPYEAYRQAVRNQLPWARIVVDHFHLVRGANTALDSVRRERQREAGRPRRPKGTRRSGKSARWSQDLYRARHRLLKARERLTERDRRRLCDLFEREPLIAEAWGLKEAFRSIYRAPDRREAERRLDHFLVAADRAQLPAFAAFAEGIRLWRPELLAYFDEPTTNGYAEGVINKIKVIKRRAYGLPTFEGYRERVLLACA